MKNIDYKTYVSNPEIRIDIEREARRARSEAIKQFVIAPLTNAFGPLLRRTGHALLVIFTSAICRFYSALRISGTKLDRSTQPRS